MTSQTIHDVLIINTEHDIPRILLTDDNKLPNFVTDSHFWQTCEAVNQAVRKYFDINAFTIRCLRAEFGEVIQHYTYSMVHHSGKPSTGKWLPITELQGNLHQLAQEAVSIQAKQPDWYALDGYKTILHAFPDAIVEQVRSWERSTVWRIRHKHQIQYLKAMPTMFSYERPLTRWLAHHFPDLIPMPEFVFDNAMLTPEYQGEMLDHSLSRMADFLSAYAEMQVETIHKLDELSGLAVPLRDRAWLEESADQFMLDEDALRVGSNPLTDDEIQKVRKAYTLLKPHLENLDLIALEHGDLHHGQIFVNMANQFTLTDFSDATLTHPFFSLEYFLWDVKDTVFDQTSVHAYLTSAYLAPFKQILDTETCQRMIASTTLLSPLFSAIRYYADILPQMAYPWEMNNMLSFYLRTFLETAQESQLA